MKNSVVTPDLAGKRSQPLVLRLFGSFQILAQDQYPIEFRSNKGKALLAYLLLTQGRPVARTTLTDLLWSDYTMNSARTNLRQVLSNLREVLGSLDLLQSDYQTVQLRLDSALIWCDALVFDELYDACQRHPHASLANCPLCQTRLQQAAALYKGAFLENFGELDSAPFQTWLQAQRARYAAQFAKIQATLRPAMPPQGNLPQPLTSLIGRNAELSELVAKLQHPVYRCVTLIGLGGMGKTRLAIALGEQMQSHFVDGVWFVSLAALTTEDGETQENLHLQDRIATVISSALRLTLRGTTRPAEQLIAYLREKNLLLILDNFEHLNAGVDLLVSLLQKAPHLQLVVTSRHRLSFQGQLAFQVVGLPLPPEGEDATQPPAQSIARYASLQLFVERAENAALPFAQDVTTLATISALCRLLEGMPLGIELAVTLLERQKPDEILYSVRTHYAALHANLGDLPQRQRSAQAVLLTAWGLLSKQEARILARCSVFQGGFSVSAAQQIVDATLADLEALVHKSLLNQASDGRFTLHELVRQFAAEQWVASEENSQAVHDRHMAYYLALLDKWQNTPELLAFRQAIQQEVANVEAAWAWALANNQVTALLAALPGLQFFYRLVCRFHQAEANLLTASSQVRTWLNNPPSTVTGDQRQALPQLLIHLLLKLCEIYNHYLAQPTQVITLAQEVIERAEQIARDDLVVEGYAEWSLTLFNLGNFTEQQQLLDKALPLAQTQSTPLPQIKFFLSQGTNAQGYYNFSAALTAHQQALTLAQAYHDPLLALRIRNNIAMVYRDEGDLGQALAYFEENLQVAQALEQENEIAYATANLGFLSLRVGDFAKAQSYVSTAHQVFALQGEHRLVAELSCLLAVIFQQIGHDDTALAYCEETLALATRYHYYHAQRSAGLTAGELYLQRGEISQSALMYQQVMALIEQTDNASDLVFVQAGLANVRLAQQDLVGALSLIEQVLLRLEQALAGTADAPELLLTCYGVLAATHDERALAILQQAWQIVQSQAAKISDPALRASFLYNVPVNRALGQLHSQMAGEGNIDAQR
ncbi:MAG: tetratricopeptide repeat protein [Caldilineaceae bacterium]